MMTELIHHTIRRLHQNADLERLIPNAALHVEYLMPREKFMSILPIVVGQYFGHQQTLGEILDAITIDTTEQAIETAFWDHLPILVAEDCMKRCQATIAVVATASQRHYISYQHLHTIITGLREAFQADARDLLMIHLNLTQDPTPQFTRLLEDAFRQVRNSQCESLTCYQCLIESSHVFSDPPEQTTCPWPDYRGHRNAPVIALASTDRCCR
jgi:hypothetical protein